MNDRAFPLAVPIRFQHFHEGMSLRAYFAIRALQGVGTWTPSGDDLTSQPALDARAEWAVAQADALIAKLESAE